MPFDPVDNNDPWAIREDRCRVCGHLLGVGIVALHIGVCEACHTLSDEAVDAFLKTTPAATPERVARIRRLFEEKLAKRDPPDEH